MKFIVNSSLLLQELQKLQGVISSNNTLPILDNILFDISDGKMLITASDLETTIQSYINIESDVNGSITIPSRILIDTLKTFSNETLTFTVNEETHAIEIISESGNYKLVGNNAEEFPKISENKLSNAFDISGDILLNAISKTLFAAGNDELRPMMSGIFLEFSDNGIVFVATDAHKLVRHKRNDVKSEATGSFIIPRKPLNILKNNLGEEIVSISFNETNAVFSYENIKIICRLIDGKYPNYEAVIPKDNPNKLFLNTNLLLSSIKRVSIYANKTTHQIRLKIAGSELQVTSEDLDFSNQAQERLTCKYEGEDLEIGFNSRFLIEMLNHIKSEEISLEMTAPNRAGIILPLDGLEEGEETLMLVMPVMLNS